MRAGSQSGFSLIEAIFAAAIVAVAAGAWLSAVNGVAHFATHQVSPLRNSATVLAEQTLRIAQDAWKYGSPGAAPAGTWQTNLPLIVPGAPATSVPVSVNAAIVTTGQRADLVVTVRYTPDAGATGDDGVVALRGALSVKAPAPDSRIVRPGLIPQPSGAP